ELWKEFKEEAGNIQHSTLDSLFTSLYWLLQKYTSFIPSAVYRDVPDIPLFDHLKTTCAIAECLYKNNGEEDFLLIGGDISGIQKFIYSITSKGAAKGLRGRSFYLQLLTETVARYVLDQLGMSIANLLYCGGGHFYILAPSNIESELEEVRREIGRKLLEGHHGELYLVLDWISFSGREFEIGEFGSVWDKIVRKLAKKKKSKFADILEERYEEIFGPRYEGGTKDICEICGSEKHVRMDDEGRKKCVLCGSFEELAKNIATANYMVEIVGDREIKRILDGGTWEDVIASFGVRYEFPRTKTLGSDELRGIDAEKAIVYRLNDTGFLMNLDLTGVKTPVAFGFKFLANATPWAKGMIKDFGELADESKGIDRWAVLRMDVDNLGEIFLKGLGTDQTVSRVSTLSSLLSLFFSGWMEKICERYPEKIYAIYSGGDDLFIVGSWCVIPKIAKKIYDDFMEFSGQNPNITLSGGIYIAPSKKYPLYMVADLAGKALDKSKGVKEKDAITFLDMPIRWSMFNNEITQLKNKLLGLIDAGVSRALLQKLYSIYSEFDMQRKKRGETLAKYDDRYGRWRWLLAYVMARIKVPDDKREMLEEVRELVRDNIEHLPIAVRW
ncbi:MAG: type III-A CRISPR-associated protein Cas10/Csm1, partial [Methanocellales archaeon]|nr:type III-A CRISPR-associated protein Cas10/Csm1 [Methanocellales archaeon]